ncbi:hypothetical protein [Plantactinospora sonchi]|uniref:Secreted protein n=1 Tax=Plantactinospora sonchi TaxID=1544735 RepID=A0ABU7S111_9ACTN
MRKKVITLLATVLVAVSAGVSLAAPAQATDGSRPAATDAAEGSRQLPKGLPDEAVASRPSPKELSDGAGDASSVADEYWDDRFRNQETGRMLDDSFEYGLRAIQDYGNPHQLWRVYRWDDGWSAIWNHATGRCLDDSWEYGLRTIGCHYGAHQLWYAHYGPNTVGVTLQNAVTGRVVDDSFEYGLRSFGLNYGPWQQW